MSAAWALASPALLEAARDSGTASGGRARRRLELLSGRERRRAGQVAETSTPSPPPPETRQGDGRGGRRPQPAEARQRAGGRGGLQGGDRGVHESVRAARRSGGVVQPGRV